MIRGRRVVEGGEPPRRREKETCDFCGEPVRKDKRFRTGLAHQRISAGTVDHDAESKGAVYRCTTCNQPVLLTPQGWVHQNPLNDGHEAKQ